MTPERIRLNNLWRERCEQALARYRAAKVATESAYGVAESIPVADGGFAFRRAAMLENQALVEYRRILEIFSAVSVRGEKPPE